jgi:16S rRNA (cytidine1402-2'-O)-methyltransferase
VQATLQDLLEELGDRRISVCRELTKLHEEVFQASVSQALERVQAPRGEFVLVIQGSQGESPAEEGRLSREDEARQQLARLRDEGMGAKDAVSQVAGAVELPKNQVYRLWIESGGARQV